MPPPLNGFRKIALHGSLSSLHYASRNLTFDLMPWTTLYLAQTVTVICGDTLSSEVYLIYRHLVVTPSCHLLYHKRARNQTSLEKYFLMLFLLKHRIQKSNGSGYNQEDRGEGTGKSQLTDLPEHYVKVDEISFDFHSHIYCNTTSYICSLLSINCPSSV